MQSTQSPAGAERRLAESGVTLPVLPTPFGAYVESVQSGNLLFISGTLPAEGHDVKYRGRLGDDLTIEQGREAAELAARNAIAIAKHHLGSLNRVTRVVRLGVSLATSADFREHPKVADAASELIESIFGKDKTSTRLVVGVSSLPLGTPVELELIFEVAA